jgi:hypothetical protein
MNNRYGHIKKQVAHQMHDPGLRRAYQTAEIMLHQGMLCADCPIGSETPAVGFVLHSKDIASFLCRYHLDMFILKITSVH